MRLRNLDAQFVGEYGPKTDEHGTYIGWRFVPSIEGAQGLWFQCPLCAVGKEYGEEDGRGHWKGAHGVLCWFRNPRGAERVPDSAEPGPGRWWAEGTSIEDLSFTFGEPPMAKSVALLGGCSWHGYITNGEATPA